MDYANPRPIDVVNRYKERLQPNNDIKKILRALQKLNEIEMTIDILRETEVGKAVNQLKKLDGIGSFAKEIVIKWKKLLQMPKYVTAEPAINYGKSLNDSAGKDEEYDPTQNWEMKKKNKKVLNQQKNNDEYDPAQNWKMKMAMSSKSSKEKDSPLPIPSAPKKQKKLKSKRRSPSLSPEHAEDSSTSSDPEIGEYEESTQLDEDLKKYEQSDEEYPSSREGSVADEQFQAVDIYTPSSVTSQTVSYKNYVADDDKFYKSDSDKRQTAKTVNNHKISKNEKPRLKVFDENEKHQKRKSDKLSRKSPDNHGKPSMTASKKSKDSALLNNKRKTEISESSKPAKKKSKTTETVKKTSKAIKPKRQDSCDLSFEQFMMMDTTKIGKKKKKKPKPNHEPLPKSESVQKSKVELHLPQIKSTYRPLPSVPPQPQVRHQPSSNQMTDELAAALHTQRNSKRMQVYSGQKGNYLPKMMSLYDQCMNVLLNNIDKLDVIGVPYDIIKPVLERCTVEQLYRLEDSNPYLLEDTGGLWEKHSQQDFRSHKPNEMESWREMYLRLYDAREEKLARLTHSIQAKVDKARPLEKRTKLAYVGVGQAKAPRNVLRAQLKYGTAGKKPIPYSSTSSKSKNSTSSSSASNLKQQVADIRMSVPVGTITASTVDNMPSNSRNPNTKKQPPRIAPMMAKTLKSINKMRYRR